ncbi:uncharacterized protein [Miscanthus floridulus]|uniref:uncharacterized protein isoform X1 n=1 Tax=Miscanthus floridulus TaxID=154761 RepID=UPI0034599934
MRLLAGRSRPPFPSVPFGLAQGRRRHRRRPVSSITSGSAARPFPNGVAPALSPIRGGAAPPLSRSTAARPRRFPDPQLRRRPLPHRWRRWRAPPKQIRPCRTSPPVLQRRRRQTASFAAWSPTASRSTLSAAYTSPPSAGAWAASIELSSAVVYDTSVHLRGEQKDVKQLLKCHGFLQ